MCPVVTDGRPCEDEETLIHFFCECPGTQGVWNELKTRFLVYTENENRYPPVTDIECLFVDMKCDWKNRVKVRTVTWFMATFLSRLYDIKISRNRSFSFDELWELTKEDLRIAKLCKGGKWLDETFFELFDIWDDSFELAV